MVALEKFKWSLLFTRRSDLGASHIETLEIEQRKLYFQLSDFVSSVFENTVTVFVMAEFPLYAIPRIRELGLSRNKMKKMSFIHSTPFDYIVIALYSMFLNCY